MSRMRYRHNKKSRIIPAHTYKKMQNVGKKKSSVLIQLSGWLRTLDMVRMFLTNLNFTLKIRLKAHIFPRTFADIASLCYDDSTRF